MSLSNLKVFIEVLSVIAAFASAAFWFQAASINPPWTGWAPWAGPAPDVVQQLKLQSTWNATAALASAISASFQFIVLAGFSISQLSDFDTTLAQVHEPPQ
jgi:hypothetical protein